MKFMFVSGGSYKGFYLNQINKIKKIHLLVFHQNIFYDFDYIQETKFNAPVSKELIELNKKLKCPILVYGILKYKNIRQECFILCVKEKISIINGTRDIYLYINGKFVLIGNKIYNNSKAFATISIVDNNKIYKICKKNHPNRYFICDKKGVSYVRRGKIYRKFRKCCYFSLSFKKKML